MVRLPMEKDDQKQNEIVCSMVIFRLNANNPRCSQWIIWWNGNSISVHPHEQRSYDFY